ncbi:hypothetical protein [Thermus caldifontis]|uniref:hypothetical protein n=1 Tax=Thermus caldifontis TaxID=1930763 RepID=UPI000DF46568|nr:hypothetical protein [Thermus caldifontis]
MRRSRLGKIALALLPFALGLALADPPPPPQGQIANEVRDFVMGILGAMLNINDWIALFKASLRDFQAGAYTIGRSLIVVGLVWSLVRAVYYGSLDEVLGAMARVVLAGAFLWFGEALDDAFGGVNGVYYAITNSFRTELAESITEASNNLKALGAVINPLFTVVAILEAGIVHLAGTYLTDGGNTPTWTQNLMAGIGAAAQLLNPASLLLVPFVITAMVLTVVISTLFMLASAFWPIVAGSLALPIGLGPSLVGRWISVVIWAFIMGSIGPFVLRGGMELGVSRPAAYIASQAKEIVDSFVKEVTEQMRTNRERFAQNLQNLATQNGWNPEVCGYKVITNPNDGRLDYENVEPQPEMLLSPRACGTMVQAAIRLTASQAATILMGLGKGLVDMFQAWAQTLFMTMGGMAAALLITGYLSTLIASFFGGLTLAVTAAALGMATQMGVRAATSGVEAAASAARGAATTAAVAVGGTAALAAGVGQKAGQLAERVGGYLSSPMGQLGGSPPAYERPQEDTSKIPWMHRGTYGEGASPIVVQRQAPSSPTTAAATTQWATPATDGASGAPVATQRWIDRKAYESGTTVPGPVPPGRWIDRAQMGNTPEDWEKGGEE